MPIKPDLMQFEVNTRCNLRCPICPYTAVAKERKPVDVTYEEYRDIFEASFTPPYAIIYSGFSEALLNPHVYRMAQFEKERECNVFVATNGKLLDDDCIARFLDIGIDQFVISLDSTRPDVYEAIRTGTDFPSVLHNVLRLRDEIVRRGSRTRIVLNSVVMKSTAAHLEALLDFMHENGLEDIAFIKIMKMALMKNAFLDEQYIAWEVYNAMPFGEITDHARKLGIKTMRSDDRVLRTEGCHLPERGYYISAEFDVSVCPYLSFTEDYVFGNLKRESIDEINDKERFARFREVFRKGSWLDLCEDCACLFS